MRILAFVLVSLSASLAVAEPLHDRLRDPAGDIPGLAGWKLKHEVNANYCGGVKVTVIAGKKKLSADDQPLADMFKITFPTGLDFSPDNKAKREAATKKFEAWLASTVKIGAKATSHYEAWIKSGGDLQRAVQGAARVSQVNMRFASLVARAEIPKDVRTGEFAAEKIAAFCDQMTSVAEPILARAEQAAQVCADKLPDGATGWWTAICVK